MFIENDSDSHSSFYNIDFANFTVQPCVYNDLDVPEEVAPEDYYYEYEYEYVEVPAQNNSPSKGRTIFVFKLFVAQSLYYSECMLVRRKHHTNKKSALL